MNRFGVKLSDKPARICIDMDNVLADFNENFVKIYNRIYSTSKTTQDISEWDLSKSFPGDTKGIYKRRGFYLDLKPEESALTVVPRLIEKYDVYILSTGPRTAYAEKCDWLIKYFGNAFRKKFIFSKDKGVVLADFLLDDGIHNLDSFSNIGTPVCFNGPHNIREEIPYSRVNDFFEFEEFLNKNVYF